MGQFKEFYLQENDLQHDMAKKMFLTHVGNGIYKDKRGNKFHFDDNNQIQSILDQDHYDKKKKDQYKRDKKAIQYALDKMDKLLIYKPEDFIEDMSGLIQSGKDLYNKYRDELLKFDDHPGLFHGSEQYRKLYPQIEKLSAEFKKAFKSGKLQKDSNGKFNIAVNKKGHLLGNTGGLFGGMAEFKSEKEARDFAIKNGYRIVN